MKGSITAFLSLLFLVMLSLIAGLVENASLQVMKNLKRGSTNLAIESLFAEYDPTLLEVYEVFAFDGSYGSGEVEADKIVTRLAFYDAESISHSIRKMELLSDQSGMVFYEQVIRYMKDQLGVSGEEVRQEEVQQWEETVQQAEACEEEDSDTQTELEEMLSEASEGLPEEDNPILTIGQLKQSGILSWVMPEDAVLSTKQLVGSELPTKRILNQGDYEEEVLSVDLLGKTLLGTYLLNHFSHALSEQEEHALEYEVEYLLCGKESDAENLEAVVKKMMAIRFALNYAYLLSDGVRVAEAGALAATLSSLLTIPAITEVVKHALLLAWAYGESLVDLRTLLEDKKVPLVKTSENWRLQLSQLSELSRDSLATAEEETEGISYQEYLRGFLLLEAPRTLCMRALDLVECNTGVRVDNCVTKLEVESNCQFRRGVQYRFCTYYGYR